MSVQNDIKQSWKNALHQSVKRHGINPSEFRWIAVEKSTGNEFDIESQTDKLLIVTHPSGIRCSVYKSGYKIQRLHNSRLLKPLKVYGR